MSVVLDTLRAKQAELLEAKADAEASLKEAETKCADIAASLAVTNADLAELEAAISEKSKGEKHG